MMLLMIGEQVCNCGDSRDVILFSKLIRKNEGEQGEVREIMETLNRYRDLVIIIVSKYYEYSTNTL